MLIQRLAVRLLIGAVLGAIPGFIVLACGNVSQGIGLIMGGSCIGGLLAIPDVSPRRVFRLFVTAIVARNIPVVQDGLVKWVDAEGEVANETPFSDAFGAWLFARDISFSRNWLVACGFVVSILFAAGVVVRDLSEIKAGRPGVTLPIGNAKDSLEVQAVVIGIAIAIWMTAGCGLFASSAYRRPILIGGVGSSYFGTCFGLLAGFPIINPMTLFLTTICLGIAMLIGAGWEPANSSNGGT